MILTTYACGPSNILNVKRNFQGGMSTELQNCTIPRLNDLSIASTPFKDNEIMDTSLHDFFQELRDKKKDDVIIAHLNINFLHNKFDPLAKLVQGKVDILIISETKIDKSFTSSQFMIDGYSLPFREDRNSLGRGLLIYAREDIPCKRLKTNKTILIEFL